MFVMSVVLMEIGVYMFGNTLEVRKSLAVRTYYVVEAADI